LAQAVSAGSSPTYAARLLSLVVAADDSRGAPARTVHAGAHDALVEPLSDREMDVLRLLPAHLSSTEIAEELYISPHTVRSHIKHIYEKLAVHSRGDAVRRARELDLL
jgi:LuxR family maltose regulon positive regulatory protein